MVIALVALDQPRRRYCPV